MAKRAGAWLFVELCREHGFSADVIAKKKHDVLHITNAAGRAINIVMSRTASDHRAYKNQLGDVRRAMKVLAQ